MMAITTSNSISVNACRWEALARPKAELDMNHLLESETG
jgi:hypothetical protein